MKRLTRQMGPLLVGVGALLLAPVAGATVLWEWNDVGATPAVDSGQTSFHNTTGPILADDFNPVSSFNVTQPGQLLVEWWGTAPLPSNQPGGVNQFEVTFHTNTQSPAGGGNEPAIGPVFGGIAQLFVDAIALDADGDGIFLYSAQWTPAPGSVRPFNPFTLTAGTDYWLSVANASGNGWNWATPGDPAGTPDIGTEQADAVFSTNGAPSVIIGPHDGPWTAIAGQDFAFRISTVPGPASLPLLAAGLALLGLGGRRKRPKLRAAQ